MEKLLFFIILMIGVGVTSCKKEEIDPAVVAGNVAKQYYQYLLDGKYEEFVDGHYQPDSIPGVYREQLITNAKMFVGLQKEVHQGMVKVDVAKASADTANHVANIFLNIAYGDSTTEEVVVPMVLVDGNWMMK